MRALSSTRSAIACAHLAEELDGEAATFDTDRVVGSDATQLGRGPGRGKLPGEPARDQLTQDGVEATDRPGAMRDQVVVTFREEPQHRRMVLEHDHPQFECRNATTAAERASCASVLSLRALSSSRARAESAGGTSSTVSPAATSCCANNAPVPVAPSIAQHRGSNLAANASSSSR